MRLETDGDQEYRLDQMRRIMDMTDERTKSGAIDFALEFTIHQLRTLDSVKDHPDMTPELAEELSSHLATLEIDRRANLNIAP
jgi:hypothetical protein